MKLPSWGPRGSKLVISTTDAAKNSSKNIMKYRFIVITIWHIIFIVFVIFHEISYVYQKVKNLNDGDWKPLMWLFHFLLSDTCLFIQSSFLWGCYSSKWPPLIHTWHVLFVSFWQFIIHMGLFIILVWKNF